MPGIRIQSLETILDALEKFETYKGHTVPTPRHFAIRATWLASDNILARLFLSLVLPIRPPVPGLFRRHILGLLINRLRKKGTYRKIATSAEGIQVKIDGQRLRAFFLPSKRFPDGICLKIVPSDEGIAARTRHEIKIRQQLQKFGTITVPKILDVVEEDGFIFILEELVKGQRFRVWRQKDLYIQQGIKQLIATYHSFGIHNEPLANRYPLELEENLVEKIRMQSEAKEFIKKLSEIPARNISIPVSMCHRDLLPSNLCTNDNILYFLDWELSAEDSIFSDLMKLPMKYPSQAALFKSAAHSFKKEFAFSSEEMLVIFTAFIAGRIKKDPAKIKKFLQIWARHQRSFS
jgi:tRNA A-37 threonylcarbamoyl transferase component Bud32